MYVMCMCFVECAHYSCGSWLGLTQTKLFESEDASKAITQRKVLTFGAHRYNVA